MGDKPSRDDIKRLTERFEAKALAFGLRDVDIAGIGRIKLIPSHQFERPHEGYGRMIKVSARLANGAAEIGFLARIAADEHVKRAISIGGVRVWEQWQRKGVATALYDYAEEITRRCRAKLVPSDLLSDDAKAFWKSRTAQQSPLVTQE